VFNKKNDYKILPLKKDKFSFVNNVKIKEGRLRSLTEGRKTLIKKLSSQGVHKNITRVPKNCQHW